MKKVNIHRNTSPGAPRLKVAHLPGAQTLIWLGPIFLRFS